MFLYTSFRTKDIMLTHPTHGPTRSLYLADGPGDILIDGIGDFRSLHSGFELHGEHPWVMPKPPEVRLVSCQACAVDPRLLSRADADHLDSMAMAVNASPTTQPSQRFPQTQLLISWEKEAGQNKRHGNTFEVINR